MYLCTFNLKVLRQKLDQQNLLFKAIPVCNAMVPGKAIETAHAIHDEIPYDISYQAILDCLSPNKCFFDPLSGVDPTGCTVKDFLEFVYSVSSHNILHLFHSTVQEINRTSD